MSATNTMHYRGYQASMTFDPDDKIIVGRVLDIEDLIGFHGESVADFEQAFHRAIDTYLEACETLGQEPGKPVEPQDARSAISKTVRYEVDLNNLPPLTDQQKAELETLSEAPDRDIDGTDSPPLDEAFWTQAVRNPFYKPTKTSMTVRLDSDVLAWLKSQGKDYQVRINAILREAMARSLHHDD